MPGLDLSPRPAKRRKTAATDSSPRMLSRALQAFKEAVPRVVGFGNVRDRANSDVKAQQKIDHGASFSKSTKEVSGSSVTEIASVMEADGDDFGCTPTKRKVANGSKVRKALEKYDQDIIIDGIDQRSSSRKKRRNTIGLNRESEQMLAVDWSDDSDDRFAQPTKQKIQVNGSQTHENGVNEEYGKNAIEMNAQLETGSNDKTIIKRTTGGHLQSSERTSSNPEQARQPIPEVPKTMNSETPSSTPRRKRGRPRKNPSLADMTSEMDRNATGFKDMPATDFPLKRKRGRPRKNPLLLNGIPATVENAYGTGDTTTAEDSLKKAIGEIPLSRHKSYRESKTKRPQAEQAALHEVNESSANGEDKKSPGSQMGSYESISPQHADPREDITPEYGLHITPAKGFRNLQKAIGRSTSDGVACLKRHLLEGLSGKRLLPLIGMNDDYQKVHQLAEQTVLAGEGNSMLIIGPRGCGKTTLVETVVHDLRTDHGNDFLVIRLNGFIHTDDKLALREIWRQLGREIEGQSSSTGNRSNSSDTLTSLLALLSHTSEADANEMVNEKAKSIIFVIDEIDLFAAHPRQTLLYNLFDVAQSRNAPVAVLGLTTRLDVAESLEKRVKSRFGQRYIYLSFAQSFQTFQDICRSALLASPRKTKNLAARFSATEKDFQELCTAWNEYVQTLFDDDEHFQTFLRRIYTLTKSISSFLSSALVPVSCLSPTNIPSGLSFVSNSLLPPDSNLHLLPALSDLELSLVIAAARLDIILDTDVCNFNMVYEEYMQMASKVRVQSSAAGQAAVSGGTRVWSREVAKGAWERLMELGLIVPVGSGGRSSGHGGMWRVDVALEEIGSSVTGMGGAMAKWCKDI
ncbi:MAG: hypothetical protein Q9190_003544 [Brigantiaea leucoxantha]